MKLPLKGIRIAPYYGCLLLRPGAVMAMDDPEDPRILEDLIHAYDSEPVRRALADWQKDVMENGVEPVMKI